MNKYLIEFMGVVVILFAKLLTEGNPAVMGIVYFSVFYMAKDITTGYFTPLGPTASYLLGRIPFNDFIYNLGVQILAMLAVVITFLPVKALTQEASLT
jgi:hypothetical protein